MKVKKIYNFLNELSPFELQEKWDNSGLLVGSMEDSFERVYISIDLDEELVEDIEANSLVIIHHPFIFSGIKAVDYSSFSTKLLRGLIKKDISVIAMHTNIDKTHLNRYVASDILGLELEEGEDFIVYAKVQKSFEEFYADISYKLGLEFTKFVKSDDFIKKVAITTGAGMSLLPYVKADCFMTGDVKYHEAMEAKARGISLIDIGHFESERFFSELLNNLLQEYLKKNQLQAIITNSKNPFSYHL